jgi:hypothetical protein
MGDGGFAPDAGIRIAFVKPASPAADFTNQVPRFMLPPALFFAYSTNGQEAL